MSLKKKFEIVGEAFIAVVILNLFFEWLLEAKSRIIVFGLVVLLIIAGGIWGASKGPTEAEQIEAADAQYLKTGDKATWYAQCKKLHVKWWNHGVLVDEPPTD